MILILLGCPEPPAMIPCSLYLINKLKKKNFKILVSGNHAALKLLDVADIERYYLKGVGCVDIDEGLKELKGVEKIISFVHNDGGVSYTITYKSNYNVETLAILFGKRINLEFKKTLEEYGVKVHPVRAFHNPTPIVKVIDKIVEGF